MAQDESIDPEAFKMYLRGLSHIEMETPDHLEQAVELLEAATLKESAMPKLTPAWSSLITCLVTNINESRQRLPFFLAKQNAEKALTLDEMIPESHVALGVVRELIDRRLRKRRALVQARHRTESGIERGTPEYGLLLLRKGDIEEGIAELNHSLALEPTSLQVRRDLGRAYFYNASYDKAISQLKDLLEIQPDFVRAYKFLALSYLQKSMFAEADSAYSTALELDRSENEVDNISFYGEIEALRGNREAALAIIDEMLEARERQGGGSASIALVYTRLGMLDQALAWLSIGQKEQSLPPSIMVDPRWEPLKDHPTFQALIASAID